VDLHRPQTEVLRAAAVHFHLGFSAWIENTCTEHPDLVTDYARTFAVWAGHGGNRRIAAGEA
jgi:hypothetical protein